MYAVLDGVIQVVHVDVVLAYVLAVLVMFQADIVMEHIKQNRVDTIIVLVVMVL